LTAIDAILGQTFSTNQNAALYNGSSPIFHDGHDTYFSSSNGVHGIRARSTATTTNETYFGTAKDSSITYDGTNMLINPKEVGTGQLNLKGDLNIDGNVFFRVPYGTYTSMKTQTIVSNTVKYYMDFNTTEDVYMVQKYGDTNFGVSVAGDYMINISIVGTSTVSNKRLNVWFQKNGVDVPRSNTPYDFKGVNAIAIISVPFIIDLNTTDRFSIMYSGDPEVSLPAYPATTTPPAPSTPSAIMVLYKIGEDMA
jgi:hypothetical protein